MKVRTAILGAVSALALSAVSATAALAMDNFSGTVTGTYANLNGGGANANIWGISGSGAFDIDSDWAIGLDAGYQNLNGSGANVNNWNISGNAFYRAPQGRVGAVIGYQSTDGGGASFHLTNYGVGGDWFAGKMWTLSAKGGAFDGSFSISGYYLGAGATAYLMPDLALSATYDYAHLDHGFGHEGDWTAQAEWLVSESTPISVYGGYQSSNLHVFGTQSFDTWFIGVRWHCNGDSSMTLVDRQRNSTLGWTGSFSPLLAKF
jgi:hypothetical protein